MQEVVVVLSTYETAGRVYASVAVDCAAAVVGVE